MLSLNKAIILMGFKHVGKSVIGQQLAMRLQRSFIDLDGELLQAHYAASQETLSCRDLVKQYGQDYFNELEHKTLKQFISLESIVISLGGGAALNKANQRLIQSHCLIHITAPRDVIFERIMASGIPAFFPSEESPRAAFDRLYEDRNKIYTSLRHFEIENISTIDSAINQIISNLH